jgi:hypothetical protein
MYSVSSINFDSATFCECIHGVRVLKGKLLLIFQILFQSYDVFSQLSFATYTCHKNYILVSIFQS